MPRRLVFVLGLLLGVAVAGAALVLFGAGWMLSEHASPVGVDETVARLEAAAKKEGWVVIGVQKIHESVKKHGEGEILPVHVMSVCHPKYAARILKEDGNRVVSVMMPCRIAVYAKADGKAYVSTMNAGLVGRLFGGTIADVMAGDVADAQQRFVDAALAP
jgi:uncharacterized protein (DUF302 family)